ncbi:MAG: hypothetical protein ACJ8GN_09390 [Longimicrobiaceae bacterium]
MIAQTLAVAALLASAVCVRVDAQQTPQRVRPPRALLERLHADLRAEDEVDLVSYGTDSLAKWITVTRRDFNGDGVREWEVEGTRYCGTNCARWIYRRLSSGRFQQVHAGSGTGIGILRTRTHGWHDITEYVHMSCCDGPSSTYVFDGRRYQWRETRYLVWDEHRARTAHRVYLTPPGAPGPQRLVLDPFDAGGGLRVSARYDICRSGRVRTDVCGAPRLILSSARLPAGRVCVRMRVEEGLRPPRPAYHSRPGGGWCGVTAPDPGARGRRRLALRPSREDWAYILHYFHVDLTGPGLPGRLREERGHGLIEFAGSLERHYYLPCVEGYWCSDMDRRGNR